MAPTTSGRLLVVALPLSLLPASSLAATVSNYTVCKIEDATSRENWPLLCQRASDPGSATLNVTRNGRDAVVVDLPAKNCRPSENAIFGGVSLVVDSSKSVVTTDPKNERLEAATELLDAIAADANSGHPLADSDPNFPRVGVVSYGGRQGIDNGWEADGINVKYTPQYCLDGDAQTAKFDSSGARARWQEKNSAGTLLSVCEFLRPVVANAQEGLKRQNDFLQFTGSKPRGGTDVSHFSEAIAQTNMLKGLQARAKNAIVITDGLPNIPKYVDAATCKTTEYLKNEKIETIKDKNGNTREVCIYRQAQMAVDTANTFLENRAADFAGINVYNVLFAPDDKVFYDVDTKGRINPPDFLIENSARTGNGKVKFAWARDKQQLTDFVKQTLTRRFDKASLQRVTVKVNNNAAYNAVSPADTLDAADTQSPFSVKLVGLQDNANTVVVTFVYADSEVSRTYTVNVSANGGTTTSPFECAQGPAGKTVDGDEPDSLNPTGDGVLPPTTEGGYQRVYRNADDANVYNRDELGAASGTPASAPNDSPENEDEDPRKLRLQGGTGNCGVVGQTHSLGAAKGAKETEASRGPLSSLLLLLAPLAMALLAACRGAKKRGRGLLSLLLVLGGIGLANVAFTPQARAEGLNSENFSANVDNKSGLMWETAKNIPEGALLLGYTFSYALRPLEFGDGEEKRLRINDHLQVNHLGVGYGLLPWLDLGLNLPFALYSNPTSRDGYLEDVGESRSWFFLGDVRVRAKFNFRPTLRGDGFYIAFVAGLGIPTGSTGALLSDGTTRIVLELPMHLKFLNTWEVFLTPGVSFWGDEVRLRSRDPDSNRTDPLLEKSESLLLNAGLRFWLVGDGTRAGSTQLEGGIRGDFSDFQLSLGNKASPVEWSAGAALWLTNALSVHGGYGTGLGRGVPGPLSRLVAGVRWLHRPGEKPKIRDDEPTVGVSSEAYTDRELDQIFEEAQRENTPPQLADEETMLRLMTATEIIDIGSINFEFDSSRLTPQAKETVRKLHEQLERLRPKSIKIDGHTDSIGSYNYNLALSKRRANSVREELVNLGQNPGIVTTEGFSFKYPLATNATKEGRTKNRRIEVAIDGRSFRKATYTREETEMFRRWIYPNNGKPPRRNQDGE
ncbi:MAG: OmpA family protein [Silvanigrellales bacterium]|nr:OmpA family protein [Silvanigrellales bacterium]